MYFILNYYSENLSFMKVKVGVVQLRTTLCCFIYILDIMCLHISAWFTGLSPVLARLVQSALRDLLLMIVVHCALVTFLPVEQMHWIPIIMFVSVLFR